MGEDFTKRFTGRAFFYSTSRPRYPQRILDILRTVIGFNETLIIADIGSGTGLLSQLFLENGNRVLAVEPNSEMRNLAEESLSKFPKFLSIPGTAEHTGIESASVDVVTVGQALHWFNCEASSREFARILKEDGHVCIVYNDRDNEDPFMKDYDLIVKKYARNRASVPSIDDTYLSKFFKNGKYSKFSLPNEQTLVLEGLLGRMTSASYMPSPSDEYQFAMLREDVGRLFKRYEKLGRVRSLYDTSVLLGKLPS
jgi:ubiquinone/menaquinone biosynthesis C-methylase UbiE